MPQVKVTSKTDFVVRIVMFFVAATAAAMLSIVVDPVVQYVFLGTKFAVYGTSFIVSIMLILCGLNLLPGGPDENMAALSTFAYVLRTHKIILSWKDAIAVSNLFSNNAYDTWYPLTEFVKLPRSERRDAIVGMAKKTGRFIDVQSPAARARDFRRQGEVVVCSCIAWVAFVGIGAARRGSPFDIAGFGQLGIVPAVAAACVFLIFHFLWRRGYVSRGS